MAKNDDFKDKVTNAVLDAIVELIDSAGIIEKLTNKVLEALDAKPPEPEKPMNKTEIEMDIAKMTIRGIIPLADTHKEVPKLYFYLLDFGQATAEMFPACEWGCDKREFRTNELLKLSDYIEDKYGYEATRDYVGEIGKKLNLTTHYTNALLFYEGSRRVGIIAKFPNTKKYRTTAFADFQKIIGGIPDGPTAEQSGGAPGADAAPAPAPKRRAKRSDKSGQEPKAPVRPVGETGKRRRSRNPNH